MHVMLLHRWKDKWKSLWWYNIFTLCQELLFDSFANGENMSPIVLLTCISYCTLLGSCHFWTKNIFQWNNFPNKISHNLKETYYDFVLINIWCWQYRRCVFAFLEYPDFCEVLDRRVVKTKNWFMEKLIF